MRSERPSLRRAPILTCRTRTAADAGGAGEAVILLRLLKLWVSSMTGRTAQWYKSRSSLALGRAQQSDQSSRFEDDFMKALQKTRPSFGLEWRDVAAPKPSGPDDVVVAVGATGLCGT